MKPLERGLLLLLLLAACQNRPPTPVTIAPELIQPPHHLPDDTTLEAGRRYALRYCQTCHLFVEPSLLPQSVWSQYIIPRMGGYLGMHHAGYDYAPQLGLGNQAEERARIRQARLYPEQPLVPPAQWDTLVAYLLANAPVSLPPPSRPPLEQAPPGFGPSPGRSNGNSP